MIKRLIKIVSILIILCLIGATIFFYSIYISVENVKLHYESIVSTKIHKELNNLSIAFFSDIKYNSFMNKERLSNMLNEMNQADADIVIFGGDMFDSFASKAPNEVAKQELIELLKEIKAPLGKFAVLGDQDLINEEIKNMVSDILYQSDFEIITNTSVRLRKQSNASITLIGLDSQINGTIDSTTAFSKINDEDFNLLVTHCPDTLKSTQVNTNYIDLALAGHSLGGQIYLPLFGPIKTTEGAVTYNHGSYTIGNTKLYVSNGLGTIDTDMRLFCPPEILVFRLEHGTTQTK